MSRKSIILLFIGLIAIFMGFACGKIKTSRAPRTLKIGLIAPFEGHYRSTGYEVLFAVKQALQTRNQNNRLNGYQVELVALNDFNEPDAARHQAQALVADPDIVGLIGHFSSEATQAALPIYQKAGLAIVIPWSVEKDMLTGAGMVTVAATRNETASRLETLAQEMGFKQLTPITNTQNIPPNNQPIELVSDAVTAANIILNLPPSNNPIFGQVDVGNRQLIQVAGQTANGLIFVSPGPAVAEIPADETFIAAYQTLAGYPPDPRAILAYDATNVLLDSIEQAMINSKWFNYPPPGRDEVSKVMITIQQQGLSGQIVFKPNGQRLNAPVWIYKISETKYPGVLISVP